MPLSFTLALFKPKLLIDGYDGPPVWGFSAGSLGAPPQSYNGVGITVALMVVLLALVFVFPLLLLLVAI